MLTTIITSAIALIGEIMSMTASDWALVAIAASSALVFIPDILERR